MDPRSLCGMTMGARKRAARLSLVPHAQRRTTGPLPTHMLGQSHWHDPYFAARAAYRLGERLRSCPGCGGHGATYYTARQHARIFVGHRIPQWLSADVERGEAKRQTCTRCDGSGTLPARRAPQPRTRQYQKRSK